MERNGTPLPPEEQQDLEEHGAVIDPLGDVEPGQMKIDLHCHSEASPDCGTPLELIPDRCVEQGVRVQAITDHNRIWGAMQIKEIVAERAQDGGYPLNIIIGEEITTTEGELIGLFLEEPVAAGLTPEETVASINDQGGLVLLPHGFDPLKRWRLRADARIRVADEIDIVETFNARISRRKWNRAAVEWAIRHDLPMSAGSDAHTLADIGSAWVEVSYQPIQNPEDLLRALEGGTPVGRWTHPLIAFLFKMWDRIRRKIL